MLVREVMAQHMKAHPRVRVAGGASGIFSRRLLVHLGSAFSPLAYCNCGKGAHDGVQIGDPWELLYSDLTAIFHNQPYSAEAKEDTERKF